MSPTFRSFVSSGFLLLAGVGAAHADVTLTIRDGSGERQIQFDADHLRIEDDESIIFDAKAEVIRVLQPSKKQYMEITREDLATLGAQIQGAQGQIAAAMKQAESALAMMPPEQRAMIEEKMKAAQSAAAGENAGRNVRFEKGNGSETLLGAKAQKYRVYDGDELQAEAWIASPKDLGIAKHDLQVFHGFVEFLQALPKQMGWELGTFSAMDPESSEFLGVPVRVTQMEDGRPGETFEMIAVDGSDLSGEVFSTPDGWKRVGPLDGLR